MSGIKSFFYKFSIASELMVFLWRARLWWLLPVVALLLVFGLLIGFGEATGAGPFIYALF